MEEKIGRPEITPEMIRRTFEALEAKGMVYYDHTGVYIPTEKGWRLLMEIKPVKEVIIGRGHKNITANHKTTFEITKEKEIGKEADCIICVDADKACVDLSEDMKNALKVGKEIKITIEAEGIKDEVVAYGSPALKLSSKKSMVVRKSSFIDSRTLAILANKAARDLKRELVEKLKNPETVVRITLEVK